MRLAITGASFCGKTTLANNLAKLLNLPIFHEGLDLINDSLKKGEDVPNVINAFKTTLKNRIKTENKHKDGFISDRCPLDIYNYWSIYTPLIENSYSTVFHDNCKTQMQKYDYVIIPPWGVVSFNDINPNQDAPTLRKLDKRPPPKMNPWMNLSRHASMIGLAYIWLPPEKIILIPNSVADIDERVAWLLEILNQPR